MGHKGEKVMEHFLKTEKKWNLMLKKLKSLKCQKDTNFSVLNYDYE